MNVVGIPLAYKPTKKKPHATLFVIFFSQPIQEGWWNPSWFLQGFHVLYFQGLICPWEYWIRLILKICL